MQQRRIRKTEIGLICLLCLTGAPGGSQQARRLSLSDALRMARERSPLSRQQNARVRGAEARVRAAGAPPNPALILTQPLGKNTGGLDESILLSQTIELGDKRRQRVRAARAERDAAAAEQTGSSIDLAFAVQSSYYEALRAEAERHLAADALTVVQTFAKVAETRFQAGDIPLRDVTRSKIELMRAEQALATAETESANRKATLQSLAGIPDEPPVVLSDSLTFVPASYRLADLTALALRQRTDLRAASSLRAAREAALHGVRAQTQPDLLLEARHSTLDPTVGGNSLRVGITVPLLDLGRNRADSRAAAQAVTEQEAALEELRRAVRLEVENSFRTWEQARKSVESFRKGRLDRARELLEMAQIGYERGASSSIELLDAQQLYRAEQTEYARSLAGYHIAWAALRRAAGGTLPAP